MFKRDNRPSLTATVAPVLSKQQMSEGALSDVVISDHGYGGTGTWNAASAGLGGRPACERAASVALTHRREPARVALARQFVPLHLNARCGGIGKSPVLDGSEKRPIRNSHEQCHNYLPAGVVMLGRKSFRFNKSEVFSDFMCNSPTLCAGAGLCAKPVCPT